MCRPSCRLTTYALNAHYDRFHQAPSDSTYGQLFRGHLSANQLLYNSTREGLEHLVATSLNTFYVNKEQADSYKE